MFVVLANATRANYFNGNGHWTGSFSIRWELSSSAIEYFWLEAMRSTDNAEADSQGMRNFFRRVGEFDLDAAVVVTPNTPMRHMAEGQFHGRSAIELARIARDADLSTKQRPLLPGFGPRLN
jgi:hypothetical protein